MTSAQCLMCGARNWTIYESAGRLVIRCGDCDSLAWDAAILDDKGRVTVR